ncbi:thioredoxin [Methanofollis fontis]|uniref:Thioredoxin n=1 Tax=Methanofollis fontis TaxID=2052832 RepID=A0A483CVZ9_9EURY|nr:thioredoxin [Methanofollis fontis]TAJ45320.1 thioredoxin [Methanofollis fontis]
MDDEIASIRKKKREEMEARLNLMGAGVPPLSDLTFARALAEHPLLVVDFWAEWCGPCRRVAPEVEALAVEYAGRVAFCKVNVDECPETARTSMISVIPTLVFFQNGRPVGRVTGALSREALRASITRAFGLND